MQLWAVVTIDNDDWRLLKVRGLYRSEEAADASRKHAYTGHRGRRVFILETNLQKIRSKVRVKVGE